MLRVNVIFLIVGIILLESLLETTAIHRQMAHRMDCCAYRNCGSFRRCIQIGRRCRCRGRWVMDRVEIRTDPTLQQEHLEELSRRLDEDSLE